MASSFAARSPSAAARISAASSAAFCAPSIATVATGMPEGIWTVLKRASSPSSVLLLMGMPITGQGAVGGQRAREVRGLARGGDDDAEAVGAGVPGELARLLRRAVRAS